MVNRLQPVVSRETDFFQRYTRNWLGYRCTVSSVCNMSSATQLIKLTHMDELGWMWF